MKKEHFNFIFTLMSRQPWLADYEESLSHLLFNNCQTEDERELIITLLSNLNYLSEAEFSDAQTKLYNTIIKSLNLQPHTTIIAAMSADSAPDSAQYLLYPLKAFLQRNGWYDHKYVNAFGKIYSEIKNENQYENIVLIDEFIGTGSTVVNRIKNIKQTFNKEQKGRNLKFYVRTIAAMEQGISHIKESLPEVDIDAIFTLQKGIERLYDKIEITSKQDLMKIIENNSLSPKYKDTNMPSLGHGESESLYCRENGNTPNNVYPIFWWTFNRDETVRPTILTRAMGDA